METILIFIVVGFVAQIIDGALGMAYGVSSNTVLLSLGFAPANASAAVHMAEVFTTFVSGISHWRLKNISKDLVLKLLIPGVIGGVLGAYVLTSIDGDVIKPWIAGYLILMGVVILVKAIHFNQQPRAVTTFIPPIGLLGGFMDAIGGGGWGPVVTTTMVARGNDPRYTIGSVNFVEFFVTFAQSVVFVFTISEWGDQWKYVVGLLIGGVIAAPMAAVICKRLPVRYLMLAVGVLIILVSLRTLLKSLGVAVP